MRPEEDVPARLAVLHTSVHTTHYADQSTDVWDAAAPAWVTCEHFDESSGRRLIEGLAAGRFHAVAFASAALQSVGNRELVRSRPFGTALASATARGAGLIVLQEFIGAGQRLRIPGLPPFADGELVDARAELSASALDPDEPLMGLDEAARRRAIDLLRRAESRASGLSPTTRPHGPEGAARPTTVFSGWRPRLPGLWTCLLAHPTDPNGLIALGHTRSRGTHVVFSALPLDRWDVRDLLRAAIGRAVRPMGLLHLHDEAHPPGADADLGSIRDAHVATGGFVRTASLPRGRSPASHRDGTSFGHLLLEGLPLDLVERGDVRALRARLERGGSASGRLALPSGPVLTAAGIPEYLRLADALERDVSLRLARPRLLLTFGFLALARLASTLEASVTEQSLVPHGLRVDTLSTILTGPLRERMDDAGTVDGFVLPSLAAAACLVILRGSGPGEVDAIVDWAVGTDAPEVTSDAQFAYLADVAGRPVPDVEAALAARDLDHWWTLLRMRRGGEVDLDMLGRALAATDEVPILALLVLEALGDGRRDMGDVTRIRSTLRPAIARLRRYLAESFAARSGTLESVCLSAAAVIRYSATGDLLAAVTAGTVGAAESDGPQRDRTLQHELVEQGKRAEADLRQFRDAASAEVAGLRAQRARLLPLVRFGLVAGALAVLGTLYGVVRFAIGFLDAGIDVLSVVIASVGSALLLAWRNRRIGSLRPELLLLRGRGRLEAELDADAAAPDGG